MGTWHATLRGHSSAVNEVAFSPDAKLVSSASYDVRLWDVATRSYRATVERHSHTVVEVEFSPGCKRSILRCSNQRALFTDGVRRTALRVTCGNKIFNSQSLYESQDWIYLGILRLFQLPPDYRAFYTVQDGTMALAHDSGEFILLDLI